MIFNHGNNQMTQVERVASQCMAVWEEWNGIGVEERQAVLSLWADIVAARGGKFNAAAKMIRYQLKQAGEVLAPVHLMPGPTGETNELYIAGRGLFLVTGDESVSALSLAGQLAASLVAGNAALVVVPSAFNDTADALLSDLVKVSVPSPLAQRLEESALNDVIETAPLKGVAAVAEADVLVAMNRKLAERDGVLVQFVAESDGIHLPLLASPAYQLRFITERTRTINITAVGGNATLLELGSGEP